MKNLRLFMTTAFVVLLLTSDALAKLPPEGRQVLHRAQMLINDKLYTDAATLITGYMNTTQEAIHAQVYVILGNALYQSGNKNKAILIFQKGLNAYPDNEFLSLNTAITMHELQRYAEAGGMFEKTYVLRKTDRSDLLYQAGSAYYLGEKYLDSARVLQLLLSQSPRPHKDWIRLAIHALLEAGQLAKAKKMVLNYLSVSPEDAEYWKLLAKLHLESEEYPEAAGALEVGYSLFTPSRQDLERLASLYKYQQAPLMAVTTLQRAYGASPEHEEMLTIAALLASAGRIQQAIDYLDRHSREGSAQLSKGKLLYQSRQFDKSEVIFRKELNSDNAPEAHFFLALCAWERKDWKQAKQELNKIIGLRKYQSKIEGYVGVLKDLELAREEARE
ncbi:tetratricopeptide repeat protein [Oleidesulfovibrio sp.]|uniref:tetratricopeptide repeat protein n=1 Tax=Oleidesulfovibrio sp. TaxID=2909707 RepID=UPI003A8B6134